MVNLTFGEQVKIILGRKGMTIKELAELMEKHTGKPMSRQNMTQRLGRDNFQEQDMRLIAEILGCKFQLSIMEMDVQAEVPEKAVESEKIVNPLEREVTIGELADMADMIAVPDEQAEPAESVEESAEQQTLKESPAEGSGQKDEAEESEERSLLRKGIKGYFRKGGPEGGLQQVQDKKEEAPVLGDFNPYTGKEYKTNSVRMHPKRIGYVQVYDQEQHKWTDMTEWAFLGYQERKKALLGKDYEPPIYLD